MTNTLNFTFDFDQHGFNASPLLLQTLAPDSDYQLTVDQQFSYSVVLISSVSLSLLSSSLTLPDFVPPARSSDGERHPHVRALSTAPAKPGRRHHRRRPVGEHLETGEPLPEPQRLDAQVGDPCEGMTACLLSRACWLRDIKIIKVSIHK